MTAAGGRPRIVLVRHGETDDNRAPVRVQGRRDVPLNAVGREQARCLADQVQGWRPAALYSSPLMRARETAEIIGLALGLEPSIEPGLAESWRGEWEGRTWQEVAEQDPDGYASWLAAGPAFRFPGGESLIEHSERVIAVLEKVDSAPRLPALVVCHGGTIRVALCHARGRGLGAFHDWQVPNAALVSL